MDRGPIVTDPAIDALACCRGTGAGADGHAGVAWRREAVIRLSVAVVVDPVADLGARDGAFVLAVGVGIVVDPALLTDGPRAGSVDALGDRVGDSASFAVFAVAGICKFIEILVDVAVAIIIQAVAELDAGAGSTGTRLDACAAAQGARSALAGG